MIHSHAVRDHVPVRVALTGAGGGYGRTLLAQLQHTPELIPAVLIDPDVDGVRRMLAELGHDAISLVAPATGEEFRDAVASGRTVLLADAAPLGWDGVDVLVEATGHVSSGTAYAEDALAHGVHVVMVSKEVDTVAGVALAAKAEAAGVRYLPGDGDQPANLLRLVDWISATGLEIVAIGKSGEYDLVFDPGTGTVTQAGVTIDAPALAEVLDLGDEPLAALSRRADLVAGLKRRAAADLCEMTVVAMRTGAVPDEESLHYPVARVAELADIYAKRQDGGLVSRDGVIDVFSALRLPGEASFAGGVFAVVRTGDPVTWEMLRGKGHVVSRDGRYACLYWPYHAMGVETPLTIHAAVTGAGTAPRPRPTVLLAARAATALAPGTPFRVAGHHHEIDGVAPVMVAPDAGLAPYYLLGDARLRRRVEAGELVRLDDLENVAPVPLAAYLTAGRPAPQPKGTDQ
ncbi:Predicted homoserine dehydrogenase, contains C-terminal SAF domain [Nonomuraea solani]|uniref:Predicted homoserine dehydrogenase, contains C-terminal SAF domain n=1 Tax=Nonomuraea solani TaxID=1144553 RepID=A0A1H6EDR7_9ACTN|nr:homoserine dehydrogenase [Nonomuraea solani]SEG95912.1 Predicted homoserine dehydrogenase, contains C-terminal SAF domain [Nonomuraea solani]